jgi:ribonuclease HI
MVSFQIGQIDVKSGQDLYEPVGGTQQRQFKAVAHSYLEHWLNTHGIEAEFFTGKFYDGVNDADRLRLEDEGKVLAFTNGKSGYFTDPETARLMTEGDIERGISPLYAADKNSPHNFVAYGSLVASDGIAATAIPKARILIIDDEKRSHGEGQLLDKQGQPIPQTEIEHLYDKMGDGTMLVPHQTMKALITDAERDIITAKAFEKAGVAPDITAIGQDLAQVDAANAAAENQINALARRTVSQFRAATPDLPGLIKGTMASSRWCDRLGVDAIISTNDIKGDDVRLSTPGIHEVSELWVNRKSDGQYGQQAVGPQVKGCIPEATRREFNPRIEAQVKELAAVAGDPVQLKQHYVERQDRQQERPQSADELGEDAPKAKSEWLYASLKADKYGQLTGLSKVNKGLEREIKGEWQESAVRGISVPSAMAQHHDKLKPWECCNKDLPHGTIVAYYRSPFPNVGAAAIAINNTEDLKAQDREAFSKTGVAYLNPWTAKHITITDFDRDANGYFVGYEATVPDLPQQLRQQLAETENLPPAEQYEAGRAAIGQLIEQMEQGQESRIAPAEYPLAAKEFVQRTAPDQKPPEIEKQKKVKHPWHEGESHSAATWRAWGITADNPTGKVANAGMTLQSFALEMKYAPQERQENLLRQVATSFAKQLWQADAGKLAIPDDEQLQTQGFPAYHFRERMEQIVNASRKLSSFPLSQRQQFVQHKLQDAADILSDAVDGPNAVNLQTAVDTAKSSRGIDNSHHAFIRGLAYKDHALRQHQKDPNTYTNGRLMPTNTQEPIGWNVEAVNAVYKDVHLPELRNEAFRDLFPKTANPQQEEKALAIARTYNERIANYQKAKDRLREKRPEDERPTLQVTSSTGRSLTLQNLKDDNGALPIWRANGPQPDWEIAIRQNHQSKSEQFVATLTYTAAGGDRCTAHLGTVAPESACEHHLAERLQNLPNRTLTIAQPQAQIQAPYAQQNDLDEMMARATHTVDAAIAEIPKEERPAYLSALWRQSDGMGLALKKFTPEVIDRLQNVPEITLTGLQHTSNEAGQIPPGEYTARFSEFSYEKAGETRTAASVAIVTEEGEEKRLGAISARSIHLPIGTTVQAHIQIEPSGKIAKMQVLDLAPEPEPQAVEAQAQTSCILATDANHCLYRFVNNDDVADHQTDAPEVLAILQAAEDRGLPHRTEFLAQANVVQAIAIIDFPNQSALEEFEQAVAPLPIQFKYEGELTGGFQFVDQQMQDMLNERPDLVSVPDAATLATFEPDGSFMASSRGASQFAVSSTQFTNQDHSFAQFPDLMVLDIDRPFEQVLPQFEERCQQHPEELWALHSTQHGTHAMRLDAPVRPDQADPEFMMSVGVDKRYLRLAQQENEWTARITPKQGRQHDRIQLEEVVGTGEPDPRLLQRATAYQVALVDNGMDAPESINYLTQDRSIEAMPMAAEPQGDYQINAPSLIIATDGACSGNPGPGGWGAVLIQGDRTLEIGGAAPDTTSNRMEMTAAIEGLKFAKEAGLLEEGAKAHIITDSQILAKGATGEWKRKANKDLWAEYDAAAAGVEVEFEWVRGHQGHPLNERADAIATSFAQSRPTELKQLDLIQPSTADESITPAGKPVKMAFPLMLHGEKNPLPVDTCLDAMRGYGRTHTTRNYEPYKAYGFKEGDIAIASSGSKQVAFQVGEQYQITPAMMNDPTYQQQWAAQEKHSPKVLQTFQGKNVWGLKMEPLGDYQDGKITPFPDRSGEIYSPSREELRQWCAVAIASGDEPLTTEIMTKGKQLNALYTQETGRSEKPPLDYRHPSLVIRDRDRQQMQQAIAAGKQTLAAMAQPQQTHKASAELAQ